MELQASLPRLTEHCIVPFALSYDPLPVLAGFAAAQGITYPLLADEGSQVIRALGILNTTIAPTHEHYGVPYPGTYFLDADGRVTDKVFHASHRTRDAALTTLREHLGLTVDAEGPRDRQVTDALVATATMDRADFVRGERIGLRLTIQIADGVHLYGQPLPAEYLPTTLEVTPPEPMTVEPVVYPLARPLRADWLAEEVPVYEGTVVLETAVLFTDQREDVTLTATLRYQACTTAECFIPERLTFTLPMRVRPFPI